MGNDHDLFPETVVRRMRVSPAEIGATARIRPIDVVRAAHLVTEGKIYDLGIERYRGLPLPAVHPAFEVVGYRSPAGIRNQGDQEWLKGDSNKVQLGFNSEIVIACTHTGTHIDALSHITLGEDGHWFNGFNAQHDLGDFGPLKADASTLLPIFTRGVLLDVATSSGVSALPARHRITVTDLQQTMRRQNVAVETGDVVLIRTGYMGAWPDRERLQHHAGAGIDLAAARWLAEQGVVAVGADTESVEEVPSSDPDNPHPVHSFLLVERGIHLIELLDLERLAADRVYCFLFVALPIKIRGATGSFIDPIAVI
jgi:kynurenine formamidase